MANLIITIDGPAASGKSTAARLLAQRIGASFLDTGAMYRAVTFAAMQAGVNLNEERQLLRILEETPFHFGDEDGVMKVQINGFDVSDQIRDPKVTKNAHYAASAPAVRLKLVEIQQEYARHYHKIVTEGRDQGTVAFPKADVKFFLTADIGVRSQRRHSELLRKRTNSSLEAVQKAVEHRDASDENRKIGPLRPATDAIVVDTSNLDIRQVVDTLLYYVKQKCSKKD